MDLHLDTQVQYVKGVGPARARALANLGIETVEDLLHHYPKRHEDRSRLQPIGTVADGDTVTVGGRVGGVSFRLNEGEEVVVTGRVTFKRGHRITNPEVEVISEDGDDAFLHTGRVVPVYGLTRGVKAAGMRRMVWNAVQGAAGLLTDHLPPAVLEARGLLPLAEAVRTIHFPDTVEAAERARRRLEYDELFLLQCALALRRQQVRSEERGAPLKVSREMDRRIRGRFPFRMTKAQDRAVFEIVTDLRSPRPMARLLQGDVGSGKTAVALYAVLVAVANKGFFNDTATTEILAEQHHRTFSRYLEGSKVRIELLVGGLKARERREILAGIAGGEVDVAVGTHALIQGDVEFADLRLAVVDEQHRFGVLQRAKLKLKGRRPDTLFMTATPIPRTLSLTAFGDLDFSVIDELPPGRKPARTLWFPRKRIPEAYGVIRRELERGRQAYFVYPLVEESEEMPLKAVTEEVGRLREEVFPGVPVGLIHGRLKREEKELAMRRFREGTDRILAATTVVEVGVDVPNATVMVVEHAERYGLSQLHQLRGRIGRGGGESTFLLLGDPTTDEGRRRLEVLEETSDGFEIAEEDLRLRGPGEVFGTRQHGLPDLKIASLVGDLRVLERARKDAFALADRDPGLEGVEGAPVKAALMRRLGDRMGLAQA
jgi:ATP-dependent DNA helicase RecG